ncbi:MAG TPA: DUF6462 family protein [Mobilitalea sp.]|nr:DUF6462 family protein [Mobilitalea sp.]
MEEKQVRAPDLDKYLEGRKHRYTTYEKGARMYSLPYWTFVNLAKNAKATWPLRKTAMVDIDLLDKYIDEHCIEKSEREEKSMPKTRKVVENLEELVKDKKKKYVRYAEGAELYSMGLHSFQALAKDAGAIRKVKGIVLINTEKVDAFIESFEEEDY